MNITKKVVIIGAGPAGLNFAILCEKHRIDYVLIEATNEIGGQLTKLYPEKEIVDIPNIKCIKAKDYILSLKEQINSDNIKLNLRIEKIENNTVFAGENTYFTEYIIICTGLGFSSPRPLGIPGENACKNILYSLKSYDFLADKKVAIFGGGDSALDWAKEISAITNDAHLIHRRTEFRGNPETIKNCKNLKIHLPYIPFSLLIEDEIAKSIEIINANQDVNDKIIIPVDYILVNYGNIANNNGFGFNQTGSFINVDSNNMIKPNIFAIGDVANYENKKRRIAPLLDECQNVFSQIKR